MATAVVGSLGLLWGWLWSERFWLPQNVSWADLEGQGDDYPRARHLLSVYPLAAGIFSVRLLFERFIAKPCALRLGIENSRRSDVKPNAILEKVFLSITKNPDKKRLEGLSKQLDWDVRKIQCWFRHRRNQDKPPTLTKFCESMWRFTFYLCMFCYGIIFLWLSPWFWDTRQCWHSYPYQLTKILNTTLFESWEIIGPYPSWWFFNGLLLVLQVLHIIWSYLIAQIALKALIRGKVSKDDRSDVESSSEEEDEAKNTKDLSGSNSGSGANCVNGHLGDGYWAEE
ncbi:PREDICTED: ceramide synthase 5 [Dipodomys ordii]|uniref:Ceramide synthase 5 n=1 Tax=Dipodomys ordii TaxID=10020 RepID=A0A1S3FCD4_DIPOR|nr:PREDICTED: ceramide synthase 5 [Dipodomys ordii]